MKATPASKLLKMRNMERIKAPHDHGRNPDKEHHPETT
jgi:hypothetical protein